MKKIVLTVIFGLFLVGCAKSEPKPANYESCGCPHHKEMKSDMQKTNHHHDCMMHGSMHGNMQGCPVHAK
ncbi:hypothetical protein [Campylobacter sp.]|uniref:hypothetical protein n=1 Tax=Campylobacter sp. TaxID=205 RepID=UPI003FA163EC